MRRWLYALGKRPYAAGMRRRVWPSVWVAAWAAAVVLGGCGSDAGGPRLCARGQRASCACPYRRIGTRVCRDDGAGYGECDCGIDGPEPFAEMRALAERQPDRVRLVDYGDSYDQLTPGWPPGSDLLALRITSEADTAPKPPVVVVAGYHGTEIVGVDVALQWARWLVDGYGSNGLATWLVDTRELWVIPVVNPDSYGLRRCNANGVDLNRNHSFHWIPGGTHGGGPASEPEIRALEQLLEQVFADRRPAPLDTPASSDTVGIFVTLHSHFAQVLWPWACAERAAPNSTELSEIGGELASRTGYEAGQASRAAYAMAGSASDWVYGTLGVPAFLVEIGPSDSPPQAVFDSETWPALQAALVFAATIADAPFGLGQEP